MDERSVHIKDAEEAVKIMKVLLDSLQQAALNMLSAAATLSATVDAITKRAEDVGVPIFSK